MVTTLSRSRMLSLRAPIATEAERALFQRRLALSALVVFLLASGFWIIANASVAIFAPHMLAAVLTNRASTMHAATLVFAMVVWACTRRGKPSRQVLN